MFVHLLSFYVMWRYLSLSRTALRCAVSTRRLFFCKFVDLRCLHCCQFIAKRIDFRVCFDNFRWFQGCLHPNQVFIAIRLWRKPQSLLRTLDAFHSRSEARSFCPEVLFLFNVCTKQHLFCAIVKMPSSTEVVFREAFVLKSSVLKFEYDI